MTRKRKIQQLVKEAFEEDKREGGRFDQDGWGNFFLEDWKKDREAVQEAWLKYDREHS